METHDGQQQRRQEASANESAASGTGARPLAINSMSLYERQAVQALQALQRQPHAAQYFQQLMLQQHINKTQLRNLAAVQQVKAGATSDSASAAGSRPVTAATASTISQSLVLSGGAGGRGQMFLRVNRPPRAPISSQLIFMPGRAPTTATVATASAATVARPPKEEVAATMSSGSQTDGELNLTVRGASCPKGVKTEVLEKSDAASSSLVASPKKSTHPQPSPIKIPTYPQPAHFKGHPSPPSSGSTSSIPFPQLLLHGTRTLTTGTAAPAGAQALVLASAAASQARAYPLGTAGVEPMQKSAPGGDKVAHGNGPVPIQPKTVQGLRLPLRLTSKKPPPIMPAPPPADRPPRTPHVPVQIVGARQSALGSGQGLALLRGGCGQEGAAVFTSSSSRLTVVASVASGEGAVPGRAPPASTSQVHPCPGTLVPASALPRAPLPLAQEAQRGAVDAPANGDATGSRSKDAALKRKLESGDDFVPEVRRPPPLRDDDSTLANLDAVSAAPLASPSPSRGVCGAGERAPPPQAVAKPHILTHVIEGFVIQEGARPFPVCGQIKDSAGEDFASSVATATMLKCECCEKLAPASHFPGTKRFCSTLCAKRHKLTFGRRPSREHRSHLSNSEEECDVAQRTTTRRRRRRKVPRRTSSEIASAKIAGQSLSLKHLSESSRSDSEWSGEDDDAVSPSPASSSASGRRRPPPSPPPAKQISAAPSSPAHWSVDQVSQFICSLQGGKPLKRRRRHYLKTQDGCPRCSGNFSVKEGSCFSPGTLRFRLRGSGGALLVAGDRRTGADAVEGGPPGVGHEHQAGPRPQDLRAHQQPEGLIR
ncbi:polyhomeotic-like protein 1 isoform X2 [Phycodurus eques]|uniref:polyhomeotic-like protein 1 isoform X2 n=1 Tax=Phycodurus eques TaxID=693459 RepID=UPI002ACE91D9|nr:polyhomeotic-like protein 1 isoform X2 [Phycodurus eques]